MPVDIGDGLRSFMGLPFKKSSDTFQGKGLTEKQDIHDREMLQFKAKEQERMYPKDKSYGLDSSSAIMMQSLSPDVGGYTTPYLNSTMYMNAYSSFDDPIATTIHENMHLNFGGISKEMWNSLQDEKFVNRLKEAKEKFGVPYFRDYNNRVEKRRLAADFSSDPWAELAIIQAQAPVGVALHETEIGKFIFKGFPKQKDAMIAGMAPKKAKGIQESTEYLQSQYPMKKENLYPGKGVREDIKNFLNNPNPVINIGETLKKFMGAPE